MLTVDVINVDPILLFSHSGDLFIESLRLWFYVADIVTANLIQNSPPFESLENIRGKFPSCE